MVRGAGKQNKKKAKQEALKQLQIFFCNTETDYEFQLSK